MGDPVTVALMPEGPQSEALSADIAGALAAEPDAARFFDGLATFYRKNYLRWIDATKRSPDLRAQRIAEFIESMKAGEEGAASIAAATRIDRPRRRWLSPRARPAGDRAR